MIILPPHVDRTPRGEWVKSAEYGTKGYIENENFGLILEHSRNGICVRYLGDGDYITATKEDIQEIIKLFNP
jgi:hypothetical protein